jgi:hypothetical protein
MPVRQVRECSRTLSVHAISLCVVSSGIGEASVPHIAVSPSVVDRLNAIREWNSHSLGRCAAAFFRSLSQAGIFASSARPRLTVM